MPVPEGMNEVHTSEKDKQILRKHYQRLLEAQNNLEEKREIFNDLCLALAEEGFQLDPNEMRLFVPKHKGYKEQEVEKETGVKVIESG